MPPFSFPAMRGRAATAAPPATWPAEAWHALACQAAAIVFEADAAGRLISVSPDPALGWPAAELIGRPGKSLLAEPRGEGFDPFRPDPPRADPGHAGPGSLAAPLRHRRCWLRRADGGVACLSMTALPMLDTAGRVAGIRGLGIDTAATGPGEAELTLALRQAAVLHRLLCGLRVERLPHLLADQAIRSLAALLGADGATLIELGGAEPTIRPVLGADPGEFAAIALARLESDAQAAPASFVADGRPVLVCPCPTRFGARAGLALWRQPGRRPWEAGDLAICASAVSLLRLTLEHGAVQETLAARARTDGVTGLANARAFHEELPRRIDRLERDRLPGTLMLITIEGLDRLGGQHGAERADHERTDEALRIVAALLRTTFRPADMIARLRGGRFAVWLDGADEMTAAERAESLCGDVPAQLAHLGRDRIALGVAVGIVMRWVDATEDADELCQHAEQAADRSRAAGLSGWTVWHEPN